MKMELSDDRIITLVEDVKLPGESFVTTFGDKIFQTNHNNNSITFVFGPKNIFVL
jgi:hypothetical protein